MPPVKLVAAQDLRFTMLQRVDRVALVSASLPVFAQGTDAALTAGQHANSEDGRSWSAVQGWLDRTTLVVQARRTGLVIVISAGSPPALSLLPLSGEPTALLTWKSGADSQSKPLAVMLDLNQRQIKLMLPFDATPEGREMYGSIISALTTPAAEAGVTIGCTHSFATRVPGQPVTPRPTPLATGFPRDPVLTRGPRLTVGPRVTQRPIVRDHRVRNEAVRIGRQPQFLAQPPIAHAEMAQPAASAALARADVINRDVLLSSRVIRADVVFRPVQTGEPTVQAGSIASTFTAPLLRPRDDVQAFPDLPRQAKDGWGQVPGREGKPPLHFRDAGEPDSFFYLPTAFKLGFGSEGDSARPPMRAEIYLDPAGSHRVKVVLVALPFIDEPDRDALRKHLKSGVLLDTVSFVRLSPAGGITARFLPDFSAGAPGDTVGLPADIAFSALEVAPDKWMLLQFDMAAASYTVFCELLKKGLRGRVILEAQGISQGVPVLLDLDEIVSDAVKVTLAELELSVENGIDLPATVSSLRAALLDTGPLPGMVFDVEEHELVPSSGQALQALGKWNGTITPQRITGWDEAVLSIGPIKIDGGAPEAWLDRVNRDPSLTPTPLKVKVALTVPELLADRVEVVQVRLRREGEASPRQEHRLTPGSGPLEMAVDVTLAELMGAQGATPSLYIEYETLQKDGRLSLPQRLAIRPTQRELVILALADLSDGVYTVDAQTPDGTTREEVDRTRAGEIVQQLGRTPGARWQVYVRSGATSMPTATPSPTPAPTPAPTGPEITILADLIAPALADGSLKKVFLVLQATAPGSPSSTLVFEVDRTAAATWRPSAGTVPPFKYAITYQPAEGPTRRVEGVGDGTTLLIEWPIG